jgi:nucleotidyltransferase/DNA polymerase involved in DNA repair
MILSKQFVEQEIKTQTWGKKLKKFIEKNAELEGDSYHIDKDSWDNFLVDVGIKKMRGVGDVIAKVTKAVGIEPCGGCQKRRKKLNERMKF